MNEKSIWTPDTSAINRLTHPESAPLIAGLRAGFRPRLTFTSISEVIATESSFRRKELIDVCRHLLSVGDCIDLPHEILKKMVAGFESAPSLNWREVPVDFSPAQDYIARGCDFDEGHAQQEREEAHASEKTFTAVYAEAKAEFDQMAVKLAAVQARMPRTLAELIAPLQSGGAFWNVAKNWLTRAGGRSPDDMTIRRFYDECDPFRAHMESFCAALYERCVRPDSIGPSLRTGRNDTFMAIYLPYCDQFVTDDMRQLQCYRQIISIAGLSTAVFSYEEFRSSFLVPGTRVGASR